MSVELSIFKVFCLDRDKHLLHKHHVADQRAMERDVKLLFTLLDMYYEENDDEGSIDKETVLNFHELRYPNAKNRRDIETLTNEAFSLEVNPKIVDQFLDQLHEKYAANEIINKLLPVIEGDKYGVLPQVKEEVEEFIDTMNFPPAENEVPVPCEKSIAEILQEEVIDPGLTWRLPQLTNIIGGVRPATLGLIYAYVDTGKTSFHLDNVACWAEQLTGNQTIAICGNEERAERLKLRLAQAFLKINRKYMEQVGAADIMLKRLEGTAFDRVKIFDEILTGEQVKYVLKTYEPSILVVDQATDVDIKTKRKADGVEYLKQLFKWYRRLANQYECGIVGVSQGVGDAENTKWLKLSDIYGSRIAIQGALDYAIGIGRKIDDIVLEDLRYLNIPKNKLHGGEGGKLTVHFTKQTCVWEEA
jgi:hypothetical protein